MRFLADESCDFRVVTALRVAGHDVFAILEGAPGTSDDEVLARARESSRILITEDHDFGRLALAEGTGGISGILLLRCPERARAKLPERVVAAVERRTPGTIRGLDPRTIAPALTQGVAPHRALTFARAATICRVAARGTRRGRWIAGGGIVLLLLLVLWRVPAREREPVASGVQGSAGGSALEPEAVLAEARADASSRAPAAPVPAVQPDEERTASAGPHVGVIVGRVLGAERHPRELVDLGLAPVRGPQRLLHFAWGAEDSFRFSELVPDTYQLTLSLFGGFPGQHTLDGIVVRAGETVELPPLELAELRHVVRLDVRDELGEPVAAPRVACRQSGVEIWSWMNCARDPSGVLTVAALGSPPERLFVGAPGFLARELLQPRPFERVVLERGPRVNLALQGGLPRLPEPWQLLVNLVADEVWELETPMAMDALGRATLDLSRSGRLYVALDLKHPDERGHRSLSGLDWWIDVAPVAGEQWFTSPPPTAEFLDIIERLTRLR